MEGRYKLRIAGLERSLPLIEVQPGFAIASFVMLGDTELVEAVAADLAARSDFQDAGIDLLVCPEAKAIPLTHALARNLGLDYVVARKSLKAYMKDALVVKASSITTQGEQILALDGPDLERLKGKTVCIVDDVVSTGGSLAALDGLLARVPCKVALRAAALLEDGGHDGEGLVYLERLPVFRQPALKAQPGLPRAPGRTS